MRGVETKHFFYKRFDDCFVSTPSRRFCEEPHTKLNCQVLFVAFLLLPLPLPSLFSPLPSPLMDDVVLKDLKEDEKKERKILVCDVFLCDPPVIDQLAYRFWLQGYSGMNTFSFFFFFILFFFFFSSIPFSFFFFFFLSFLLLVIEAAAKRHQIKPLSPHELKYSPFSFSPTNTPIIF